MSASLTLSGSTKTVTYFYSWIRPNANEPLTFISSLSLADPLVLAWKVFYIELIHSVALRLMRLPWFNRLLMYEHMFLYKRQGRSGCHNSLKLPWELMGSKGFAPAAVIFSEVIDFNFFLSLHYMSFHCILQAQPLKELNIYSATSYYHRWKDCIYEKNCFHGQLTDSQTPVMASKDSEAFKAWWSPSLTDFGKQISISAS